MVRGFGVLLVVGIAIAFAVALTAGLALLSLTGGAGRRSAVGGRRSAVGRPRRSPTPLGAPCGRPPTRRGAGQGDRQAGARSLGGGPRPGPRDRARGRGRRLGREHASRGDLRPARARAQRPAGAPERRPAPGGDRRLRRGRGRRSRGRPHRPGGGRLDERVQAARARERGLQRRGDALRRAGRPGSARSSRCPTCSATEPPATSERVEGVLDLLPPYFLAAFVNREAEGSTAGTAVIPFGIKVMPFDEQKQLIDSIRAEIDPPGTGNDPPQGVSAEVVGLPVLAADANSALESNRYLLTLAGLAAVALALLAIYRSARAGAGAADPDRARDRLVVARPGDRRGAAEPDVGDPGRAGDRDRDRVQRPARRPLRGGARGRRARRGGASPRLLAHRDGGARLRDHGDRRLRGADRDRHPHASRLRPGHGARSRRRAARSAAGPAGGARLGRDRVRRRSVRCCGAGRACGRRPTPG